MLKRTGFKRKLSKPMKRTPLRKVSLTQKTKSTKPKVPTTKSLSKKVWELCRKITFKRYGNTCYTTGSTNLSGMNLQCGHGKPKGALPMKFKYDLRNLRPQSYHANINLGGMSDIFIAKLEREKEGLQFLKEACVKIDGRWEVKKDQTMGTMEAKIFLEGLIDKYTEMLSNM